VKIFEYRVWRQIDNPFGEEHSGKPYYDGLWGDPQQWTSVNELNSLQAAIPFAYMKAKLRQCMFSVAQSVVSYIHVGYTLQFDEMMADILLTSPSLRALELSPCDVPNLHQRGQFTTVKYLKIRGDYRQPIYDVEGSFLEAFPNLDHFAGGEAAFLGSIATLASPRLRTLEAELSRSVGQRVGDLTTFLSHHPHLESVSLNLGRARKPIVKDVPPLKIQMCHLTSLSINFTPSISWSIIGEPDDANLWLALLSQMPALERLQLHGWVWSTLSSLEKILDSLAPGVELQYFLFTIRSIVTPEFMRLVARRLPMLERLEVEAAEAKVKPHAHAWPVSQVSLDERLIVGTLCIRVVAIEGFADNSVFT
jgi:hypothetical protein